MADPNLTTAEEWRPVPGWEGLYEVSSLGRVRGVDRLKKSRATPSRLFVWRGRPIKLFSQHGRAYLCVNLCRDGGHRLHLVHRLVAAAFLPGFSATDHVDHINAICNDNRVANLRRCTPQENNQFKVDAGRHAFGSRVGTAKLDEAKVRRIKALIASGCSDTAIAADFSVCPDTIGLIRRGLRWRHV